MKIQKILHQLSEMGHKEIIRSTHAARKLLLSAGGAGLIAVFTVVLKIKILHAPLSLFAAGFFGMLNFVASFFFMQACRFRLATKQAPLIGAALGRKWIQIQMSSHGLSRLMERLAEELKLGIKTQLLSAAGNLLFVMLGCSFFHCIWVICTGAALMSPITATAAIQSLHPYKSGSAAYAAFTGGILWFCALGGGFLAQRFKPFSKTKVSLFFNLGLGAALAYIPIFGHLLGLPLEVRHFTLSSGTLMMAMATLGPLASIQAGALNALLGVILIGIMNFSVSFALAFISTGWNNSRKATLSSPFAHRPLLLDSIDMI